jgi:hypothetical protein
MILTGAWLQSSLLLYRLEYGSLGFLGVRGGEVMIFVRHEGQFVLFAWRKKFELLIPSLACLDAQRGVTAKSPSLKVRPSRPRTYYGIRTFFQSSKSYCSAEKV